MLKEKISVLNKLTQCAIAVQDELLKEKVVELMEEKGYKVLDKDTESKVDSAWCGFIIIVPEWENYIFKVAGQDYDVLDKKTHSKVKYTGKFDKNAAEMKSMLENSPQKYVDLIINTIKKY